MIMLSDMINMIVYFKSLQHPLTKDHLKTLHNFKSTFDFIDEIGVLFIAIFIILVLLLIVKLVKVLGN